MESSRKSARRNRRDDLQSTFERALEAILARVCLSAAGAPPVLAVAYSGGLDSSVLLQLARQFARARGLPLHALHIHHGLSPHADDWLRHCRAEAMRHDLPFHSARVEVDRRDPQGVEQAARLARYRQLGVLCRQLGVTVLLTGHHQDDQAETVFLQMMRGAGLPGLSGMPLLRQDGALLGEHVFLARPLLMVARDALRQAASRLQLRYVEDESNADLRYRRNGVRHQAFPALASEFPAFSSCLARTATHLQAAQRLLDEVARADLQACVSGQQDAALEIPALKRLSDDRLDNLLRYWLRGQGVGLPSTVRLEEIRRQMEAAADVHPFFEFGPVQLRRVKNRLELLSAPTALPRGTVSLRWQGQAAIEVPEWGGRLLFEATAGIGLSPGRLRAGTLEIRPRSGSERLKPALNRPSRNLKQLFQERAIPPWQRPRLPLVYLDERLVMVGGIGMDARIEPPGPAEPGIVLRWQSDPAITPVMPPE